MFLTVLCVKLCLAQKCILINIYVITFCARCIFNHISPDRKQVEVAFKDGDIHVLQLFFYEEEGCENTL